MVRRLATMAVLGVSLAVLGCSSSDDETPSGGQSGVELGPYPEGPYGHTAGSVFPNLQWEGYVNESAEGVATAQSFVPYSTDSVRHSGRAYALIHVSEFW